MSDIIDKIFDLGFGIASYSREKIEEVVNDLVKRGEIAKQDAEKTTREMIERGRKEKEKLEDMIDEKIEKQLAKYDYVKKSDLEKLLKKEEEKSDKTL